MVERAVLGVEVVDSVAAGRSTPSELTSPRMFQSSLGLEVQTGYPLVSGRPRDHLGTPGDHLVTTLIESI